MDRSSATNVIFSIAPPLAVVILSRIVFIVAGAFIGVNAFNAAAWMHWDSTFYRSIALHGYELHADPNLPSGFNGTTSWMPLYPWTVRGLAAITPLHIDAAMMLVPLIFRWLTLTVLWIAFLRPMNDRTKWLILLAATFFPGAIYQQAAFPMSMATFFILLHLRFLLNKRWLLAGICGALAPMSHSVGWFLCVVTGIWVVWPDSNRTIKDRAGALLAGFLTSLGIVAVLFTMQLSVGTWRAYFITEANYDHSLRSPIDLLWYALRMFGGDWRFQPPSHQMLLVTVFMLQAVISVARSKTKQAADQLLAIFCVLFWFFPMIFSGVFEYRSHATLLPCAILLRNMPHRTQFILTAMMVFVAFELSQRYLLGYLT